MKWRTRLEIKVESEVYALRHVILFLIGIFKYSFRGYPMLEAIRSSFRDREKIYEAEMAKLEAELKTLKSRLQ